MAKNNKKRRSIKVHTDSNGNPCIKFGGKYLSDEMGLLCGERLELIRDNDVIILRKFSRLELEAYETAQEEKAALSLIKKLFPVGAQAKRSQAKHAPTMMVAEARTSHYTVANEISRHLKEYSQN